MDWIELAASDESVLDHLWRYEAGSAKDANAEIKSARLILERVRDELLGLADNHAAESGPSGPDWVWLR